MRVKESLMTQCYVCRGAGKKFLVKAASNRYGTYLQLTPCRWCDGRGFIDGLMPPV
jgi:hypothetical protein